MKPCVLRRFGPWRLADYRRALNELMWSEQVSNYQKAKKENLRPADVVHPFYYAAEKDWDTKEKAQEEVKSKFSAHAQTASSRPPVKPEASDAEDVQRDGRFFASWYPSTFKERYAHVEEKSDMVENGFGIVFETVMQWSVKHYIKEYTRTENKQLRINKVEFEWGTKNRTRIFIDAPLSTQGEIAALGQWVEERCPCCAKRESTLQNLRERRQLRMNQLREEGKDPSLVDGPVKLKRRESNTGIGINSTFGGVDDLPPHGPIRWIHVGNKYTPR